MKRKITIVSILFVLIFLVACGNNNKKIKETFNYALSADQNEYYLTKYQGSNEEVVLPEEYLGKKITKIEEYAFIDTKALKKLTISKNVSAIGKHAFENSSVEEIVFAEGTNLAEITNGMFYGASKLNKLVLPSGITSIGDYAFYGTTDLTSLIIPSSVTSIGSFVFYESGITSVTIPNNVTEIPHSAFYGAHNITTINIGQNVTTIGFEAFGNMAGLTSINVNANNNNFSSVGGVLFNKVQTTLIKYPEGKTGNSYSVPLGVKVLGASSFFQASKLKNLTLPEGLTEIKEQALGSANSLEKLVVPESVNNIAEGAFYGLNNLNTLTISLNHLDVNKTHFGYVFGTVNYEGAYIASQYRIPNKLRTINLTGDATVKKSIFLGMNSILTLNVDSSITNIEEGALKGLTKLNKLVIPFVGSNLDAAGEEAYLGYIFGTEDIDDTYAAYHPIESKKFYIPTTLKEVEVLNANEFILGAFNGISSLTHLNLPFVGKHVDAVGIEGLFGYIFGENDYSGSYPSYHLEEDKLFYIPTTLKEIVVKDGTTIIDRAFYGLLNIETIKLPMTIISIGEEAFDEIDKLREIVIDESNNNYSTVSGVLFNKDQTVLIKYPVSKTGINYKNMPETVTEIADNAFKGVKALTSVNLSSDIDLIGFDAFVEMTNLKEIIVDEENINYSSADGVLFNKAQTTLIKFPEGKVEAKYTIPENVTVVSENSFKNVGKLVELNLGNIETILEGALTNMVGVKKLVVNNEDLVLDLGVLKGASTLTDIVLPFIGKEKNAVNDEAYFGYIFGSEQYPGSYSTLITGEEEEFFIPNTLKNITIAEADEFILGAFKGVKSVVTLTIPFVGKNINAIGAEGRFGYIFGTKIFPGAYAVDHPEEEVKYYVPAALREVILTESTTIIDYAFKDIRTLSKVVIPSTVINMGKNVFELINGITIYVDLEEKPATWDENWNVNNRPVVWK